MIKVLVLMSTYNGEKYIRDQIDSILGQDKCSVDLLVRDDGSTDKTTTILDELMEQGKLKWYSGDNLRPGKSFMNLLVSASSDYDYYAFADQDDIWKKDKLYAAAKMIGKTDRPALYCGNAMLVDNNLSELGLCNRYILNPNLVGVLVGGGIQGATIVMNKALKKCFGENILSEDVKMHDYYVTCVCLSIGGKVLYDQVPYLMYRQHGGNVIGVNKSIVGTIKKRYEMMTNSDKSFDIEKTSENILRDFSTRIGTEERSILEKTANYKKNIANRFYIMRNPGVGLGRTNIRIALSIGILLGKI